MQKSANLEDLVKSFPMNIFLQYLTSIQKRTSPMKFAHLAENSEEGSIPNLSTKVGAAKFGAIALACAGGFPGGIIFPLFFAASAVAHGFAGLVPAALLPVWVMSLMAATQVRSEVNNSL